MIRSIIIGAATAVALAPAAFSPGTASAKAAQVVEAPQIIQGRKHFWAEDYRAAYNTLMPYRKTHTGSLEVDFLLGASACKIDRPGLPAWGRDRLMTLRGTYDVTEDQDALIRMALRTCGSSLQPATYAQAPGTMTTYSGQFPGFGAPGTTGTFRPLPLDDGALAEVKAAGDYDEENAQAEALRKNEIKLRRSVDAAQTGTIKVGPEVAKVQGAPIKLMPGLKLDSIVKMKPR